MRNWSRETRAIILLNAAVVLALAIGWSSYALYGHRLLEAMYKGESIEILNSIIEGQNIHPLSHYLQDADKMMWIISLVVVAFSVILTFLLKMFSALCFVFTHVARFLSRTATPALTAVFLTISLSTSAVVFFYPLEIENREAPVWLHVLALEKGINLYDHSQVAFIGTHHGPFDSLFKFGVATLFPFLESWQVTRIAVFLLPFVFLTVAWKLVGKYSFKSVLQALCLGSMGHLFLVLSGREFLFAGRTDATVAMFLLLLIYASISFRPRSGWASLLHGLVCGAMGTAVVLTSWRIAPAVFGVLILTIWIYRRVHQVGGRAIFSYLASYAVASLGIWAALLVYFFDGDPVLYYKHFFAVFSKETGWGSWPYNGSVASFVVSLFNPTAVPWSLKGGPVLLVVAVYAALWGKGDAMSKAWLVLSSFVFFFCALAYYLNYYGGGSWYFIPFLIILWFYLCGRAAIVPSSRLAVLGSCVLALTVINVHLVVLPTVNRVLGMRQAYAFTATARFLESTDRVFSEDTFFFKTSYQGELIDSGDFISIVAKLGYYGGLFNDTARRHFDQVQNEPPAFVITGIRESPELRELIKTKYTLIAEGPRNGRKAMLFKRNDLIIPTNGSLGPKQVDIWGLFETKIINSKTYRNPFDFKVVELQAVFTSPSGRQINFFGFYDGDGNGGQSGNVWKLRFMPDEVGTWTYAYNWTDETPGGFGSFTVIDSGLSGPLKIATDRPWFFMTSRGEPFHARPYGMQDFGPRIKSSSGWESNSQQVINVLKTKVLARDYNMVMAAGPNRFGEGRSYWWKNQRDIFDVAVWGEYEKVLRFGLNHGLYFFPFDGMAEQAAFGMPVSRFTKYLGNLIPFFDRTVGRVTPVFKRYMVARYGPFASFMGYSPTWEWPEFWSESAANEFMTEIRNWNPFPTLLTAHDSSRDSFSGWMGFSMRQAEWKVNDLFGGNCRACGQHGGIRPPFDEMPILAAEDIWEAPSHDTWYYPQNTTEVRRGAWGAMMAGVIPVYSEWYWDFFMGNGTGEAEVRRMFDFFYTKTRYRHYQQLNQLVSKSAGQIASGTPGEEYVVYDQDGGSITIDLSGIPSASVFSVLWFDPKTGLEQSGGTISGGASKTLNARFSGDTVLFLRRVLADATPHKPVADSLKHSVCDTATTLGHLLSDALSARRVVSRIAGQTASCPTGTHLYSDDSET